MATTKAAAFEPEGTEGIRITHADGKAIIEIDLAGNFGLTSTGKAIKVANSKGWCDLGPGVRMNLLATRKPAQPAAAAA